MYLKGTHITVSPILNGWALWKPITAGPSNHAFNSSAATPHESRMGAILGRWRTFAIGVMITLLVVCALTYLHSATGSSALDASLAQISEPTIASQMRVPVALSHILPIGVKGMLLAVCLMGIIAGDGIHLHSWGGICQRTRTFPKLANPNSPESGSRMLVWRRDLRG